MRGIGTSKNYKNLSSNSIVSDLQDLFNESLLVDLSGKLTDIRKVLNSIKTICKTLCSLLDINVR